jgi:hypothetical protein
MGREYAQTCPHKSSIFSGSDLPGAYYTRQLPEKLKNWQLEVDALLEAQL